MPDDELILERIKKSRKPTLFCMDGRIFTPEDQVREAEEDTPIGRTFKRAEELMLKRTLERKRAAGLPYAGE